MKRSVIFTLSMLSSILCSISLFAQTGFDSAGQFDGYDFSTFTINGLEMAGQEYTEQDIIRAFGQPDTVEFDEFGYTYTYFFESDVSASAYKYAADITLLYKPKGPIMTAYVYDRKYIVNGFIRVGDPISKVYEMDGDFSNTHYNKNRAGAIFWRPTGTGWENVEFFNCPKFAYNEDGVITSIGFWSF